MWDRFSNLWDRFSNLSFDRLESRVRPAEPVPQGFWDRLLATAGYVISNARAYRGPDIGRLWHTHLACGFHRLEAGATEWRCHRMTVPQNEVSGLLSRATTFFNTCV